MEFKKYLDNLLEMKYSIFVVNEIETILSKGELNEI